MNTDWHHLLDFIHQHSTEPLALATLIASDGSSYRQPGARLLINSRGQHAGSLSGGCLEQGIAQVALKVLADGNIRTEHINTEPHFGCPGILTIIIERIQPNELLQEISNKITARLPIQITTNDTGSTLQHTEGFQENLPLRPRLIVIGWTNDQDPIFQLAHTLNWECIRVLKDPRMLSEISPVASESLTTCCPSALAKNLPPDPATAVLIMSHHMATDLAALKSTVIAGYPYVGLLGSKRRRERLLNELGECGMLENATWLDNFHAPIGLDLGAEHPSTIALSILAEIQAAFTGATGLPLTEKIGRIN